MSLSDVGEAAALALFGGTAQWYLALHLGPPGENGTANAAPGIVRAPIRFGAPSGTSPTQVASDGGTAHNGAAVDFGIWVGSVFPNADFVTHWSLWDAAVAGNCWATGAFGGLVPRSMLCDLTTDTMRSTVDHAFAAGDIVTFTTFAGLTLPAPLARDTLYTVTTANLTLKEFSVSASGGAAGAVVDIAANGACIVEKVVGKLVNTDDPVRVGNGEVVLYLD